MFERMLMPSDGSEYALRAARYAADVAVRYKSDVTIIYVMELPPVIGMPPPIETEEGMRQEVSRRGQSALELTRAVFTEAGIDPHDELVYGSAVPTIIRYVRDGNFDLLVMGSRGSGTGAIDQILIGSVAEGILHGAPCPILMVRPE